jgi:hypothetical protein
MSHVPAKANLSVLGSNYKFGRKIDTKEVQKSASEYIEKQ